MPVYEFECNNPDCGCKFQVLYTWKFRDGINVLEDPEMQLCPKCGDNTDHLDSLATMRPDRFWRGVYDDRLDIYTTSESRHRDYMRRNDLIYIGDRTDREGLTKMAEEGMKAKDRKAEKAVEKEVIDTLAWKDEWGDYGTVGQINRKRKARLRMESECQADVSEDSVFK